MGEFLLQNRNSTTVPKSATSQVLPKHLWRRSGVDIFVFAARGSSNQQLGTRLDGINWRRALFHSLKGASLLSIRSAFQRGLAATLRETN